LFSAQSGKRAFLRSDDPEDPIETLNIHGSADRPQVDHIVPRSKGGSNSFRNARIISKHLNGMKSAALDAEFLAALRAAVDPRPVRQARTKAKSKEPSPRIDKNNRFTPY
jgi:5-methylcytosine-specific restriction endonuclease McrA